MSDENGKKENPGELDLSELSSLSLEPSWASGDKAKKISIERFSRDERRGNAFPRDTRRAESGAGQPHRDRRPPRREFSPRGSSNEGSATTDAPFRRERPAAFSGENSGVAGTPPFPPRRRERAGDFRHHEKSHPSFHRNGARAMHVSPRIVDVSFFPEDKPFSVLAKAIKTSARTYGLFEIARLILEKPERFVVSVKPLDRGNDATKNPASQQQPAGTPPPRGAGAPTGFFLSVPDGMPFLNELDATSYVFDHFAESFFSIETVETDPPKGNFTMVSKCGFTGKLLAPPNYHAYQQILRDFHAANFPSMPFEKFMSRLETVREKDAIDAWLDGMKTIVRYTVKDRQEGEPETLDGAGAAKAFLVANRKNKVVRPAGIARISGKLIEKMPGGPLKSAIENAWAFQQKKPLDTANFLRGRLRRSGFTLFKRTSKGITLVCAIRRKFRTPDSVFSDTIQRIFDFLEKHPDTKIQDLPQQMLGIEPAPAAETQGKAESARARATGTPPQTESGATDTVPAPDGGAIEPAAGTPPPSEPPPPTPASPGASPENDAQIAELLGAVRWLVLEGYVSELPDGSLFTHPKMTVAQAKAAENGAGNPAGGESADAEPEDDIAAGIPPAPDASPACGVPAEAENAPAQGAEEPVPAGTPPQNEPETTETDASAGTPPPPADDTPPAAPQQAE